MRYTKVTIDYQDIRLLVTMDFISETTEWILIIKLILSAIIDDSLLGMSFDYIIETAYKQTITILYKYFYIWELNLRFNNINYYLSFINFYFFIIIDI